MLRRAIAITLALCGTAHADPEKAKQLSTEAEALVASGDLLGAAAKFRAAYKLEPLPEHMCNSGVAYHKAKDLPRSHRYLNQCVTMGSSLDPTYRENLRKVVEAIETKLVGGEFTPIDIAVEPASAVVTFDSGKPYDDEIVGGGRVWVPYGSYRLVARADGYLERVTEVAANTHDAQPLRVILEKAPIKIEKPIPQLTYVDGPRPSKTPALIATGATAVLGITALVFYVRARGFVDDAESPTLDIGEFEDLRDKARSNQRIAWVFGGVAGATAIVSGFLWYRALRTPAQIEVTSTGTGVAIRGRF